MSASVTSPAATAQPRRLKPPAGFFFRQGAARYLAVSITTLRKREIEGIYAATEIDEWGRHLYSLEDLERMRKLDLRKRRTLAELRKEAAPPAPPAPKTTPERLAEAEAARKELSLFTREQSVAAFRLLDSGKTPAETALELELHCLQIEKIYECWRKLSGALFLTHDQLEEIGLFKLEGEWPPKDARELIENLREISETRQAACAKCGERARSLCLPCATGAAQKASTQQQKKNGEHSSHPGRRSGVQDDRKAPLQDR